MLKVLSHPLFSSSRAEHYLVQVWDISGPQPAFVGERALGLGTLHTLSNCPDVPFVVAAGGDKSSDNFKVPDFFPLEYCQYFIPQVMDLRELAPVRSVFGKRQLSNPLNTTEFGFATAEEAEPAEVMLANMSHALFI